MLLAINLKTAKVLGLTVPPLCSFVRRGDRITILFAALHESAIGPKRTSLAAAHMSAFGGRADMAVGGNTLSRSLLGVKRTCCFAAHMSAYDPKRTSCRGGKVEIFVVLSIVVNPP